MVLAVSFISVSSIVTSPFSFLILLIWVFSHLFLISLADSRSILLIFSNNQLLVLFIFTLLSFLPNSGKYVQIHLTDFYWGHTTSQAFYEVWIWRNQWPQPLNPWPYLAEPIENYRYEPKIETGCFMKMSISSRRTHKVREQLKAD